MTNTQLSSHIAHTAPPAEPTPVEYHMALTSKKRHPMVGVAAILTLIVGMNTLSLPLVLVAGFLDGGLDRLDLTNPSPFFIAAQMLSLALLTPISMAIQHLFYGVDFRTLHSAKGKLGLPSSCVPSPGSCRCGSSGCACRRSRRDSAIRT